MSTAKDLESDTLTLTTNQQHCRFLRLPRELRNEIYRFVFGESLDDTYVEINKDLTLSSASALESLNHLWTQTRSPNIQILFVNAQIREEASNVFLNHKTLVLKYYPRPGEPFVLPFYKNTGIEFERTINTSVFKSVLVFVPCIGLKTSSQITARQFAAEIAAAMKDARISQFTEFHLQLNLYTEKDFTNDRTFVDNESWFEFGRDAIKCLSHKFSLPKIFEIRDKKEEGTCDWWKSCWAPLELAAVA